MDDLKHSIGCPVCNDRIEGGINGVISHCESKHDMTQDQVEDCLGARNVMSLERHEEGLKQGSSRYGSKK